MNVKLITAGTWEAQEVLLGENIDLSGAYTCFVNTPTRIKGAVACGESRTQAIANALLIAEAGTVANESGLSPRELLNQRNELLSLLRRATYDHQNNAWTPDTYLKIEAAINQAAKK